MISDKLMAQLKQCFAKEPKIKLAYVFGSAVSGRVKSESDFDLGVMVDDASKISYGQVYRLIADLSFPKDLDLSIVDKNSSPLFLFQIISTGKCAYRRSEEEKIFFEAFVLKNYYDNAHLRKIYNSYLKDKFPDAS